MSTGFKKSLFGFNCDEVIDYIEKAHLKFQKKENELNNKNDSLTAELNSLKQDYQKLTEENARMLSELTDFRSKQQEINRLAENIGKLYLVAQTNAKTIMDNALQNKEITDKQVNDNLSLIDVTHTSFNGLKENIIKSSYDFVAELDTLIQSLEQTKLNIVNNDVSDENAKNDFEKIYQNIVK